MLRIDRIRQMTDEELAEFLSKFDPGICRRQACPDTSTLDKGADRCAVCFLHWLREALMDGEDV